MDAILPNFTTSGSGRVATALHLKQLVHNSVFSITMLACMSLATIVGCSQAGDTQDPAETSEFHLRELAVKSVLPTYLTC